MNTIAREEQLNNTATYSIPIRVKKNKKTPIASFRRKAADPQADVIREYTQR